MLQTAAHTVLLARRGFRATERVRALPSTCSSRDSGLCSPSKPLCVRSSSRSVKMNALSNAAANFLSQFSAPRSPQKPQKPPAADTVRTLYDAVNARDLDKAMTFFADDCVYEDMIYKQPFVGIDAIRAQFGSIYKKIPADLAFVVRALKGVHQALTPLQGMQATLSHITHVTKLSAKPSAGAASARADDLVAPSPDPDRRSVGRFRRSWGHLARRAERHAVPFQQRLQLHPHGARQDTGPVPPQPRAHWPRAHQTDRGLRPHWHLHCSRTALPQGPDGLITYVRDIPEPSSKPGDSTLWILNALSALIRKYPSIAAAVTSVTASPATTTPAIASEGATGKLEAIKAAAAKAEAPATGSGGPQLPELPGWASPALWGFYAAYMYALFLSPDLPGDPGINPAPETLQDVLNLSLNFFYVLPTLNNLGIPFIPTAPEVHPASLAIFNVVNAWSIMFLGLIARDPRGKGVGPAQNLWLGQVFLTNVFFIPFLALRAGTPPVPAAEEGVLIKAGKDTAAMGVGALFILLVSVGWFSFAGGDAYGGFSDRVAFSADLFASDRVWIAFALDCVLYSTFQAWLISDERAALRQSGFEEAELPPSWLGFVPYVGLGSWLALRPSWSDVQEKSEE